METTIVMMKYLNIDENAPKMKILKEKFDKKEIQNLPKSIFEGRIITIQTSNEADKAIEYLMKQSILKANRWFSFVSIVRSNSVFA